MKKLIFIILFAFLINVNLKSQPIIRNYTFADDAATYWFYCTYEADPTQHRVYQFLDTMSFQINSDSMRFIGTSSVFKGNAPKFISWIDENGYLNTTTVTAIPISSTQIISGLGYTPYNSTNPNEYINSVPAQSFSSLTGKPSTLSGYGITDAYPLSGNPSNFLTAEVDGSIVNEIQTLSVSNRTITISSGNYITIPTQSLSVSGYSLSITNGNTINLPKISTTDLSGSSISITKYASGVVSPNTGNGYSIDISGVGLTNLLGYTIIPIKNSSSAIQVPNISVKTTSSAAIVVNIVEGTTVVLGGPSAGFANTSGLSLQVIVWGN